MSIMGWKMKTFSHPTIERQRFDENREDYSTQIFHEANKKCSLICRNRIIVILKATITKTSYRAVP